MYTRQQPRWVPPLPPGWEAKFDPGQNTYFFINHHTKTTQWEDPRFQKPTSTSQPPPTASAAATSLNTPAALHNDRELEALPMQDFSYSRSSWKSHRHSNNESSLSQDTRLLRASLHSEFPSATKELIADLLTSCQNDETKARQQLKDLGFNSNLTGASSSGQSSSSAASAARSSTPTRAVSPSRKSVSPARHAASPARQQQTREPTEAEKQQVVNLMTKECPSIDPDVIKIAAATCNFNLAQCKELIKAWEKKMEEKVETTHDSSQSATSSGASSSRATPTQPSQQSLLPAGLSDTPTQRASSSQAVRGNTLHGGDRSSASPARAPVSQGARKQESSTSAQQVASATRPRQKKTKQTAAVTSQPTAANSTGSGFDSTNKTAAVGPNSELCKGPDSSLLLSEYSQALGPDRSLREGPTRSRAAGPQGCLGPDPTIRCCPHVEHLAAGAS